MLVRNIVAEVSGFPSILYTQNLLICELSSSAASGLSDFHPHQLLNWQSSITLPGPNEGGCFNKVCFGNPPAISGCHLIFRVDGSISQWLDIIRYNNNLTLFTPTWSLQPVPLILRFGLSSCWNAIRPLQTTKGRKLPDGSCKGGIECKHPRNRDEIDRKCLM